MSNTRKAYPDDFSFYESKVSRHGRQFKDSTTDLPCDRIESPNHNLPSSNNPFHKHVYSARTELSGSSKPFDFHDDLSSEKNTAQFSWRRGSLGHEVENETYLQKLLMDTNHNFRSTRLGSPSKYFSKGFAYDRRDNSNEQLLFDVKRKDKTIEVLKDEINKKTQLLRELRKEIDELRSYKLNVELNNESHRCLQESRVTAKIALNAAELDSLRDRNERLECRFSEMEELLKQKDTELHTLQQQAREREEEYFKLTRELHANQYELSLKNAGLMELKAERNDLDETHVKQLHEFEENTQQQIRQLEIQHKYGTAKLMDQINEIERKHMFAEKKIVELTKQIVDYELVLQKANNDKEDLCNRFIELEAELEASLHYKAELSDTLEREKGYQKEIERLQTILHCFDKDNLLLKNVQNDNASLTHEIIRLKQQLARQSAKSTADSSSNLPSSNIPMTSSSFPKPIELRRVLTSSTDNQQQVPSTTSIRRDHWSSVDKWKLDF